MADTLPGCFGYYGAPLAPNGPCEKCKFAKECREFVRKDDEIEFLKSILATIEKVER